MSSTKIIIDEKYEQKDHGWHRNYISVEKTCPEKGSLRIINGHLCYLRWVNEQTKGFIFHRKSYELHWEAIAKNDSEALFIEHPEYLKFIAERDAERKEKATEGLD